MADLEKKIEGLREEEMEALNLGKEDEELDKYTGQSVSSEWKKFLDGVEKENEQRRIKEEMDKLKMQKPKGPPMRGKDIFAFIVLLIVALGFIVPILLVIMNSFKGKLYVSNEPFALPNSESFVGFKNYIEGIGNSEADKFFVSENYDDLYLYCRLSESSIFQGKELDPKISELVRALLNEGAWSSKPRPYSLDDIERIHVCGLRQIRSP